MRQVLATFPGFVRSALTAGGSGAVEAPPTLSPPSHGPATPASAPPATTPAPRRSSGETAGVFYGVSATGASATGAVYSASSLIWQLLASSGLPPGTGRGTVVLPGGAFFFSTHSSSSSNVAQ